MKTVFITLISLLFSLPSFSEIVYTREHRLNERVTVYSEDNGKTWGAKVDNQIVIKPEYIAVTLLGSRYLCLTKYDTESQTLMYGMANMAGIIQLDCEYEHMSMRRGRLVAFRAPEVFGDEDEEDDSNFEYLAADDKELLPVTVVENIIGRKETPAITLDKLALNLDAQNSVLAEIVKEKETESTDQSKDTEGAEETKQQEELIVATNEEIKEAEQLLVSEYIVEVSKESVEVITPSSDPTEGDVEENTESPQAVIEKQKKEESSAEKTDDTEEQDVQESDSNQEKEQLEETKTKEAPAVKEIEEQKTVAEAEDIAGVDKVKEDKMLAVSAPLVATSKIEEDAPSINIDQMLLALDLQRDLDMEKDFLLAEARHKEKERNAQIIAEMMPFFPGGEGELELFIKDNLEYPEEAKVQGVQGKVVLRFLVAENGNTQNIEVVQSLEDSCDKEAKRIVELMPRWQPGLQNGVAVPVHFTLPISFYF